MRADEPATVRERIFARDRYTCVYCAEIFPFEMLTLDHVQPRMRGGDNTAGNVVTACARCNTLKGARPAWEFLAEDPVARSNFLTHAAAVWPRHRRAIIEAARKVGG